MRRAIKLARELRKNMNVTERRVWVRLRGRQMDGWKFRRQAPIGPFIVDFYCPAAKLVIEMNGASHINEEQWDYDQRRRRWLESRGFKVLTFAAEYPEDDYLLGVWDAIDQELALVPAPPRAYSNRRTPPARDGI